MTESPSRHFNLVGASNFRDLGGYPTMDGRRVRWRRIFRSNHLGRLTGEDIAAIRALGVRSAFDFRGVEERADALCGVAEITVHSLPVEPTVVAALREVAAGGGPLTEQAAIEAMQDSYRSYVQANTPRFRALFGHLLEDHAPLVIHCTAGKDRTGFASALILHALGVADEVISEDYLLTNRFYRLEPSITGELPDGIRQVLGSVQESFLAASFAAIEAEYSSVDGYIRDGLGIGAAEREQLAGLYLERV